ncbi:MAG: hypothetical protein ACJAUP_001566 [Cellvibrionaceae bacterium]|jgi:hypothetical protein
MKQLPINNGGWLLAQRDGRIALFENDAAANTINSVLDIRSQVPTNAYSNGANCDVTSITVTHYTI